MGGGAYLVDLAASLMAGADLSYHLDLALPGCSIRVLTDSRSLLGELTSYFRPFARNSETPDVCVAALEAEACRPGLGFRDKEPDPGKARVKEEFADVEGGRVVRKKLTGMLFLFGGGLNLAVGPCLKNVNQVVNFVNNRYIQWMLERGCLLLHSSGVAHGRDGLAIAGRAGAGKSTLALHLMNLGTSFVSNDRLMARREKGALCMYGLAKLPRINPGTALNNRRLRDMIPPDQLAELERMAQEDLWGLERKYDVNVTELFGKDRIAPGPVIMRGLVVLEWSRKGSGAGFSRMRVEDRPEALDSCMKSPGLFYLPPGEAAGAGAGRRDYLELLGDCPLLLVEGGVDFSSAAAECDLLLRSAAEDVGRP